MNELEMSRAYVDRRKPENKEKRKGSEASVVTDHGHFDVATE